MPLLRESCLQVAENQSMEQIEERFKSERRDKAEEVCLGLSIDKCSYRLDLHLERS